MPEPEVRKPKIPEGCPEATVREKSDELTLRAEKVGTLKTHINVNHIEEERWGSAFFQALYKGIEGDDWEDMYESYKKMSRAVGVRKPQQHSGKGENATGAVGRAPQRSNCGVG